VTNLQEIAKLANHLNPIADQLKLAKQDLETALTRISASEQSCLNLQHAIFKHLEKIEGKE